MVMEKHRGALSELRVAQEMLNRLVDLARNAESEQVRLAAQDKILDRAYGKAPQHVDVTAMRHTEIVYRSAQEIRQELLDRGVPRVLLDYTKPPDDEEDDSDKDETVRAAFAGSINSVAEDHLTDPGMSCATVVWRDRLCWPSCRAPFARVRHQGAHSLAASQAGRGRWN